jgi:hypothetical protein
MKHVRPLYVTLISVCLLVISVAVFHYIYGSPNSAELKRIELDDRATYLYEHDRGLSPCDRQERDVVNSVWAYTRRMEDSTPDIVVLTSPTFSEITVTAFRPNTVKTYTLDGHTGFGPPSAEWFSSKPGVGKILNLEHDDYAVVASSLSRHIRYPMTAMVQGLDGTRYYFGIGADGCATTWSPSGGGPADLITRILAASESEESPDNVIAFARAIEEVDGVR